MSFLAHSHRGGELSGDIIGDRLRGLARNPALPAEALLRLATDSRIDRWDLTDRPEWTDEAFDALAAHPDPEIREALAQSPGATGAQRARLVGDLSVRVLHAVLEGPPSRWSERLPDWAYRRLAEHPEPAVRDMLTFLPGVPRKIVALLATDPQPHIAAAARALLATPPPGAASRGSLGGSLNGSLGGDPQPGAVSRGLLGGEPSEAGGTGREQAISFASGEFPWNRARAAADPELPGEWVATLAADPSPQVRLAVSMRPGLSEEQRAAIDHVVPDELPVLDWVLAAGPEQLRECARSAHAGLRRSAACHPDLPADLVTLLAADDDAGVRLLLCEHQATLPGELLLRTYLSASGSAASPASLADAGELLRHPSFPGTGLARLASSPDPRARALAQHDPAAPDSLIEQLSHDPDPTVRAAMASDGRLPLPRLLALFDDPLTTGAASANPHLPRQVITRILDDL